jgi:hypothetical protein
MAVNGTPTNSVTQPQFIPGSAQQVVTMCNYWLVMDIASTFIVRGTAAKAGIPMDDLWLLMVLPPTV